jgi:hypothetical protein
MTLIPIKSVRIRSDKKYPKVPGGLDAKLELVQRDKDRVCIPKDPTTNEIHSSLTPVTFTRKLWGEKSDYEIIQSYLSGIPDWKIVEDPFTTNPPYTRRFGEEQYLLNSGAKIKITWLPLLLSGEYESKWSDDSGFEIKTIDGEDKSTIKKKVEITAPNNLDQAMTFENEIKYSKDSPGKEFDGVLTDLEILTKVISDWRIKVPGYDKLAVYNPTAIKLPDWQKSKPAFVEFKTILTDDLSYLGSPLSDLGYKSPLKKTPTPVTETPQTGATASPKIKITINLPTGELIKAKEDISSIIITVGSTASITTDNIDPEYVESAYQGPNEDYDSTSGYSFTQTELERPDDIKPSELSESQQKQAGVNTGGSNVKPPSTSVSNSSINLPGDLSGIQNSKVIKVQMMGNGVTKEPQDIVSPQGQKILASDIIRDMNRFVTDVLGPFATFLKQNYSGLYKNCYITSGCRGYIPQGGSLTSQHLRGQAIDFQILGATSQNPGKNIELLNAILEWYKNNPVGYGQILFETRGNSCWIHWSYSRGSTRLQLLRFKEDKTYAAAANKTGAYILPPLTTSSLGFSGLV